MITKLNALLLTREDLIEDKTETPVSVDFKSEAFHAMAEHSVVIFDNGSKVVVLKNRYGSI